MNPRPFLACLLLAFTRDPALAGESAPIDFRYAPPEWQTAICLPDDPHKSLVDHHGALLYHYRQGGREFGTRISVEVTEDAVWQRQELLSPRIPMVRTFRAGADWRWSRRPSRSRCFRPRSARRRSCCERTAAV